MATAPEKAAYTPHDLLAMPEGVGYELVGGNLVARHMGALPNWVGENRDRIIEVMATIGLRFIKR